PIDRRHRRDAAVLDGDFGRADDAVGEESASGKASKRHRRFLTHFCEFLTVAGLSHGDAVVMLQVPCRWGMSEIQFGAVAAGTTGGRGETVSCCSGDFCAALGFSGLWSICGGHSGMQP